MASQLILPRRLKARSRLRREFTESSRRRWIAASGVGVGVSEEVGEEVDVAARFGGLWAQFVPWVGLVGSWDVDGQPATAPSCAGGSLRSPIFLPLAFRDLP